MDSLFLEFSSYKKANCEGIAFGMARFGETVGVFITNDGWLMDDK